MAGVTDHDAAQIELEYGIQLLPWQREVLTRWKSGNLLVRAARRTGKDFLCALLASELVKAGQEVLLACPHENGVRRMREVFDEIRRGDGLRRPSDFSAFQVTHYEEERCIGRITVTARVDRGARAAVGIACEAGCMTNYQIEDLERAADRIVMVSSWPPNPDRNRFGWLWRYGGLEWQRLEVPGDLAICRTHARDFGDQWLYIDQLRSPHEVGGTERC